MKKTVFSRLPFVFCLVFCFLPLASLQSQTVKQLETQRKQALERLETATKMLQETEKSQKNSLNKLSIINHNIKERQNLITAINNEISALDTEIMKLQAEKTSLESQLQALRSNYAKIVRETAVYQSFQSKIMFVLSANSFQQTARRLRYLQQYGDYRKEQAAKIEQITQTLALKNDSLVIYKNQQLNVARQKNAETQRLSGDRQKEQNLYNTLKKKTVDLKKEQLAQQKKADELNAKVEQLIAEEIRKAEEKAKKQKNAVAETQKSGKAEKQNVEAENLSPKEKESKTTAKTPSSTANASIYTKEEILLAGDFQKNQGRLPYPVEKGFISGHYGVQAHPFLEHVTINNKGIYIQTPQNSLARAVFDGVVVGCFKVKGSNTVNVMIQHGEYRTLYANLTDIYVEVGQKVKAKQNIGKIYTDDEQNNRTELFFQIRQKMTILNPENWLAK